MKIALGLFIWFVLSIPFAFLMIGWMNQSQGRCFFHGLRRRLVIDTGIWEYFECPVCGVREAEKIYGITAYQPANLDWLNGKEWC